MAVEEGEEALVEECVDKVGTLNVFERIQIFNIQYCSAKAGVVMTGTALKHPYNHCSINCNRGRTSLAETWCSPTTAAVGTVIEKEAIG